jgi:hypothetical protein
MAWRIDVPSPAAVANSNRLMLRVELADRPDPPAVPIALVGSRRWRLAGPFACGDDGLLHALPPEQVAGDMAEPTGRGGTWREVAGLDNRIPLPDDWIGALYAQCFLHSELPRAARIGTPANCPTRAWVNGELAIDCPQPRLLRPNYSGDGQSYADVELRAGWNEVLVKLICLQGDRPTEAHLTLAADKSAKHAGLYEVEWTRLPWDV